MTSEPTKQTIEAAPILIATSATSIDALFTQIINPILTSLMIAVTVGWTVLKFIQLWRHLYGKGGKP